MTNTSTQERAAGAIYHQLPAAHYLAARFRNDFESAVLHAINGGGQNQARTILTGALVGAQVGHSGIPQRFLDGLEGLNILKKAWLWISLHRSMVPLIAYQLTVA